MKIPDKIKIGAHIYDISFRDDMDDSNFGVCRPSKLKIFVDSTVAQSQQEETLIHEIFHAVFAAVGMSKPLNPEDEERDVQALAHMIYQVLKENDMIK